MAAVCPRLLALSAALGLLVRSPAQDPPPDPAAGSSEARVVTPEARTDELRLAVAAVVRWLESQAQPVEDLPGAVLFRSSAESRDRAGAAVYGGSAGVLIFLENAALVLQDARARALADACAKGLLAEALTLADGTQTWSEPLDRPGSAALYLGDAGIGHAFLVRSLCREDRDALRVAVGVGDALLARALRDDDGLHWSDEQVEMIYGAAGTSLFLLELAEASGETRFRAAALRAAHWLIAQSEVEPGKDGTRQRRTWRWSLANHAHYPNFSHGTAGVAYALARVAEASGDSACLEAARDGAEWLLAHAIREGALLRFPMIAGNALSLGGWCHGPPGTARLFLYLHGLADDERYLPCALQSMDWLMAQAPQDPSTPLPPSLCCGVAGALDWSCALFRSTRDERHAAFADRCGDWLLGHAIRDEAGMRWRNGASSHGNAAAEHGLDLMLGASGEAMALLRLVNLREAVDPVRHLPDRRVERRDQREAEPAKRTPM